MTAFSLPAPAKVNLSLHILGKRPDGYHRLDSIVAFTDIADRVTVRPADTLCLEIDGPFASAIPPGRENLVLRAAGVLQAHVGITTGAAIQLEKHLPAAGGIGGGTSDAATAMILLNRLWSLDLPPETLTRIGVELGADFPVCLLRRAARMEGIGEHLTPLSAIPEVGVVLLNPGVPVSTGDVFRTLSNLGPSAKPDRPPPFDWGTNATDLARILADTRNDLSDPAIALQPVIADAVEALRSAPGCRLAGMSGSGATCFALFDDEPAARTAADLLRDKARTPDWWVASGRLLSEVTKEPSVTPSTFFGYGE